MVDEGGSQHYVDPWQEYKAICSKLKKRFLRKPNVAEAAKEFAALADRLQHDEQCSSYAGLCHLAIARCEHQVGNVNGEGASLKQAARLFMNAEMDRRRLGLPGYHQNLNSSIHCYGHAVKNYFDQKHMGLAANLCMELGAHLVNLDRPYEAVEYFDRAVKFYDNQPWGRTNALEWLCLCYTAMGHYAEAIKAVNESRSFIQNMTNPQDGRSDDGPIGVWRQRLSDYEIAEVLLLLALDPLPRHMTESQTKLLQKYTWVGGPSDPSPETDLRDADCFLLLQSFVMAINEKDSSCADAALTDLQPYLKPFLLDLGLQVIENLEND